MKTKIKLSALLFIASITVSCDNFLEEKNQSNGTISISSKTFPTGGTAMFSLLAMAGDLGGSIGPGIVALLAGLLVRVRTVKVPRLPALLGTLQRPGVETLRTDDAGRCKEQTLSLIHI